MVNVKSKICFTNFLAEREATYAYVIASAAKGFFSSIKLATLLPPPSSRRTQSCFRRRVFIPLNITKITIADLPSEALAWDGGERGIRTLDPVLSGILA